MTTQPVDPAREAARQANGRFGSFSLAEAPDVELDVEPAPGSLDGYLPDVHLNGGGFGDFCGGCGDQLTAQGECVACTGPFEEAFSVDGRRFGLVTSGDEVVIETSSYELVDSFRPASLGLADEDQVRAHAERLVRELPQP